MFVTTFLYNYYPNLYHYYHYDRLFIMIIPTVHSVSVNVWGISYDEINVADRGSVPVAETLDICNRDLLSIIYRTFDKEEKI